MEKLNEKKLDVLRESIIRMNNLAATLCDLRPDIYSVRREDWTKRMEEIRSQIGAKQELLFIGPFSSGKSSFINALLGENILPTSNRPCTSVVTELSFVDGGGHRGRAVRKDNSLTETEVDYASLLKMVDGPTGAIGESAAYHHIELQFDITQLPYTSACLRQLCDAGVMIVDCPGYGSPYYSNEDIIEEYISKASHTFWINPVDRIGSLSDYKKLSEIRKKTTTLIPIMSKADLLTTESKREEVRESYEETIGSLFHSRDPIFCSALKYHEAMDIEKEIRRGKLPDDVRTRKEQEMNVLLGQSGLSNVFAAVIDSASEKSVTDAKVKSVYFDLDEMASQILSVAEKERSHWQRELKMAGWEDGLNLALENARKEVAIWIEGESERVGRQLDNQIKECIQGYIDACSGKVSRNELLNAVVRTLDEKFLACSRTWGEYLSKTYGEKLRIDVEGRESGVALPSWLNSSEMTEKFVDARDVVIQTIRDAGIQTVAVGGVGVALICSASVIPCFISALASVATVVGVGLVGVAAVSALPVYTRYARNKKDEQRRTLERRIDKWLGNLNMKGLVWGVLTKHSEETYKKLSAEHQKEGSDLIDKKSQCDFVIQGIESLHERLQLQFAESKRTARG